MDYAGLALEFCRNPRNKWGYLSKGFSDQIARGIVSRRRAQCSAGFLVSFRSIRLEPMNKQNCFPGQGRSAFSAGKTRQSIFYF